ncbi:N-lysine methyltransferase KMT5A-like isoform X1 [Maylandia zebra]|uniref:N-lysine methyltransferase KMT5A-like isoform X1 n=1 Tax=Maylandia zebra TaxID=106582 RepID=UPI00403D4144
MYLPLISMISRTLRDVYRLSRLRVKNMSKRRLRLRPEAEAAHFILSGSDKTCLKAQWINDYKGRGVFASEPIEKGSFVVEYRGELISEHERDKRQKKYTEKQTAFLFDFKWKNSTWCIDASREDDSLGRLVNDDHKYPNCKMKQLAVQDKPHLCLFAIENIQAESEITYDYGESMWPWRALTPSVETLSQPPTDQETPSVETLSQPPTDQETPSVETLSQPPTDQEVSDKSTSFLQQVTHKFLYLESSI